MRYLIEIRIDNQIRTYRIDASDENEAIERLKLRLPPHKRDDIVIDTIEIDPSSFSNDDPFGIYLS